MSNKIATREAYGKALAELAKENENVVVLDADLSKSTKTADFKAVSPERFFNMGIAEANMMGVAAGLSTCGKIPFVSTFAMFAAGRAFEQIRNSICYPKLNVKVCATHAGLTVGEDGASHQTVEDLSLMRSIPNMVVISPADAVETKAAIKTIANYEGPCYVRLGRAAVNVINDEKTYEFIEDVIKEVVQISPSKYIQIGGDEALSTNKEDYDYFVGRVAKIAKKYGKIPIGWDPIDTSPEINSSVVLQNWKDSNNEARKKNMKIIVSIAGKTYLDMKYNDLTPYGLDWAGYIPIEDAYKWDITDYAPKNLALGLEAPLWTETISTQEQMDYMIYPRLLGYAEIGWTDKEDRSWEEYKVRLEKQEKSLEYQGVNYYKES